MAPGPVRGHGGSETEAGETRPPASGRRGSSKAVRQGVDHEIGEAVQRNEAIRLVAAPRVIIADSSGEALRPGAPSGLIRLLVGPKVGDLRWGPAQARMPEPRSPVSGLTPCGSKPPQSWRPGFVPAAAGGRPENNELRGLKEPAQMKSRWCTFALVAAITWTASGSPSLVGKRSRRRSRAGGIPQGAPGCGERRSVGKTAGSDVSGGDRVGPAGDVAATATLDENDPAVAKGIAFILSSASPTAASMTGSCRVTTPRSA